jgi:hypothetical protein
MRLRETLGLVIVALLAAGCGDGLGPGSVAGTWALARIGAAPLPAVVYTSNDFTVRLTGDTLVLRRDGSGERIWVQETEYHLILRPNEVDRFARPLSFRLVNGRIEVSMACGPLENCTPPPHMVLTPDDNVLRDRPRPGQADAPEYEFVAPAVGVGGL